MRSWTTLLQLCAPPRSAVALVQDDLALPPEERFRRGLGEHVRYVICGAHIDYIHIAILDTLSDEVVTSLYVSRSRAVARVITDRDSSLVILKYSCCCLFEP